MRTVLVASAFLFSSLALAIDLDQPGAMEALARENPAHYAKVEKILSEAPYRPFASVARWIRTEFNARDVNTSNLLKTSYPAQARLSFVLDDQPYSKVIRIDAPARAMPAK
jgi:hypothetical protein